MSITKLDCMELKDTRYSVYPYDGYNLEEILGKFYEAIKECNDLSFSLQEFNTWLIDEGLIEEVEKQLIKVDWDNIVNSGLYQAVIERLLNTNNRIEEVKNELSSQLDTMENEIINLNNNINDTFTNNSTIEEVQLLIKNSTNSMCYMYYVGDSILGSNGQHILNTLEEKLDSVGTFRHTRQCKSGLRLDHWVNVKDQGSNYPTVDTLINAIPETSDYPQIVIIELGINGSGEYTTDELTNLYQQGLTKLKTYRPNVKIILLSPMRYFSDTAVKKISTMHKNLVSKNEYLGYINCIDNVFKVFNEEIQRQYFVDNTHPNEKGQLKIAEYIIRNLLPQYNPYVYANNTRFKRLLKGGISPNDPYYKWGVNSNFRIEIMQTGGDKIVAPIIKKTNGKFYIHFDKDTNASLSTEILPKNGYQTLGKASWNTSNVTFKAHVEIGDYDILNEIVDGQYFALTPSTLVSELSMGTDLVSIIKYILDRL